MTEGIYDLSTKKKVEHNEESDPLEGMSPEEIIDYFTQQANDN